MNDFWIRLLYLCAAVGVSNAQISVSKKHEKERKISKQLEPYSDLEPELKLSDKQQRVITKQTRPAILNYRPASTISTTTAVTATTAVTTATTITTSSGTVTISNFFDAPTTKMINKKDENSSDSKQLFRKQIDVRINPNSTGLIERDAAAAEPMKRKRLKVRAQLQIDSKSTLPEAVGQPTRGSGKLVTDENTDELSRAHDLIDLELETPQLSGKQIRGRYKAEPIVEENKTNELEYPVYDPVNPTQQFGLDPKKESQFDRFPEERSVDFASIIKLKRRRPLPTYIATHYFRNSESVSPRAAKPSFQAENENASSDFKRAVSKDDQHTSAAPEYQMEESPSYAEVTGKPYPEATDRPYQAPGFLPEQVYPPREFESSFYYPKDMYVYQPAIPDTSQYVYQPAAPAPEPRQYQPSAPHHYRRSYLARVYEPEVLDYSNLVSEPAPPAYRPELPLTYSPVAFGPVKNRANHSPRSLLRPPPRGNVPRPPPRGNVPRPPPVTSIITTTVSSDYIPKTYVLKQAAHIKKQRSSMVRRCPPLNPFRHSQPHPETDLSCEQGLPGWSHDSECMCDYPIASRDPQGCPRRFYTLCYRSAPAAEDDDKNVNGEIATKPYNYPAKIPVPLLGATYLQHTAGQGNSYHEEPVTGYQGNTADDDDYIRRRSVEDDEDQRALQGTKLLSQLNDGNETARKALPKKAFRPQAESAESSELRREKSSTVTENLSTNSQVPRQAEPAKSGEERNSTQLEGQLTTDPRKSAYTESAESDEARHPKNSELSESSESGEQRNSTQAESRSSLGLANLRKLVQAESGESGEEENSTQLGNLLTAGRSLTQTRVSKFSELGKQENSTHPEDRPTSDSGLPGLGKRNNPMPPKSQVIVSVGKSIRPQSPESGKEQNFAQPTSRSTAKPFVRKTARLESPKPVKEGKSKRFTLTSGHAQ